MTSLAPMQDDSSERGFRALILLIKVAGVVGFVGLLVAARYVSSADYACRVLALVWFFGFGVAYVLVSAKGPENGRRWP